MNPNATCVNTNPKPLLSKGTGYGRWGTNCGTTDGPRGTVSDALDSPGECLFVSQISPCFVPVLFVNAPYLCISH